MRKFCRELAFESFGVGVTIESDSDELLNFAFSIAADAMLGKFSFIENKEPGTSNRFGLSFDNGKYELYRNGTLTNSTSLKDVFFKYFCSMLRLTVAENAVDKVFVHAGTVAWNGKAVIFPASSFRGKTSIVVELIKAGAEYYSDEYAVIDSVGLVHPFPRALSVRGLENEFDPTEVEPELFDARIGTRPVSVGTVILTQFVKGVSWQPVRMSVGEGILETIPHTIPLHANTIMSLNVLNLAFEHAMILKGPRGEAKAAAIQIVDFLDKNCN